MSIAGEIMAELRAAELVLTGNGEQLRIDSPLGRPLPEALKQQILTHRAELLTWLAWNEWADEQLLAMTRRIAAAYRPGCTLDTPAWQQQDQALEAACRTHEDATFMAAIERYEEFALECFASYEHRRDKEERR